MDRYKVSLLLTFIAISLLLSLPGCGSGSSNSKTNNSSSSGTGSQTSPSQLSQTESACLNSDLSLVALGGNINIGGADTIGGDILLFGSSSLNMGGSITIDGTIFEDSNSSFNQGGNDTITGGVSQADRSSRLTLLQNFINALSSLPTTVELSAINGTTTIQSTGALNIVHVAGGIVLNGTQKLTLQGGAEDVFIVNVDQGFVSGGGGAGIYLAGGLQVSNVIFNFAQGNVSIGGDDQIHATLITSAGSINLGGDNTINGALVSAGGISIGGSNGIWQPQAFCIVKGSPSPTPTPNPSPTPSASPQPSPSPTPTPVSSCPDDVVCPGQFLG